MLAADERTQIDRQLPRLADLLLIVLVFLALGGDPAPHVNEPYYLCRLKHGWNPAWCAADFYLNSADAHLTFVVAFGWLTKLCSLSATAWIGRIVCWTLLAWAWQRLSWRVVHRPVFAVLSAALWVVLIDWCNLAGEWVVGGFESKCVAYVFVLLALDDLAASRWNRVWLCLGAASAMHVLVGGWSVIICAGIWFLEPSVERRALNGDHTSRFRFSTLHSRISAFRKILPGLVGGGLLALAGVIPALRLTWNQPADTVAEANRIYVFDRLPHHLSILTVPAGEVVHRLIRHGLLIAALAAFSWATRHLAARTPIAGNTASTALRRLNQFAWGAVILATLGLAIELILWTRPELAASLLRFYWFRLTDVAVPLAVAMNVVALVDRGFTLTRRWAPWALAAAILAAAAPLIYDVRLRFDNPVPPSDAYMASFDDWVDVCQWAEANTPADAMFLTPRMNQSFKWRTGRAEVATRKDLPQDASSIVEWSGRVHNIYYHDVDGQPVPVDSIADLGVEHLADVAKQYGVDYVIASRDPPLPLSVQYANNSYVVYCVQHAKADAER
jgi:hypothetical protein